MTDLESLYFASNYHIFERNPKRKITLKIDSPHPKEWDSKLSEYQTKEYVILTGTNPCSGKLTKRENHGRNYELLNWIKSQKKIFFLGMTQGEDPSWDEFTFCILGIKEHIARKIAFYFAQNAFIYGKIYSVPKLIWTIPDNRIRKQEP
jgi:hypothetical protein